METISAQDVIDWQNKNVGTSLLARRKVAFNSVRTKNKVKKIKKNATDLTPQVRGLLDLCGDHGGKWETSLLMHLDPGMQDIGALPNAPEEPPIGASNNGVEKSNADFGKQAVDAIVEAVDIKVKDLLENLNKYQGHGAPQ